MKAKEPTKEQQKEFWEQFGARCKNCGHLITTKVQPDICCCHTFELDLDLNNLFKWAVPKLHGTWSITPIRTYEAKDLALALFWTIWEVIHSDE